MEALRASILPLIWKFKAVCVIANPFKDRPINGSQNTQCMFKRTCNRLCSYLQSSVPDGCAVLSVSTSLFISLIYQDVVV